MTEVEKQQIHDLRMLGSGYRSIGAVLGISRDCIRGFCKRNGLDGNSRSVSLNPEEKIKNHLLCPSCSKSIKKKKRGRGRQYCSDACRRKWWKDNPQSRNKKETAIYSYA
jgi:hypothetical protein